MRPVAKRALEIINYEIVLNISCQILTSAASPMEQRHQQRLAQFQAGLSAGTGRCRGMGKHVHEGKRRTGRCSQQGESEKEFTLAPFLFSRNQATTLGRRGSNDPLGGQRRAPVHMGYTQWHP